MGLSAPSSQPSAGTTASLNLDARGLDALRNGAKRDPKAAIAETARQFEGLFMSELMKGMRKGVGATGMLENAGSQMGTEMLDAQFATRMTGQPGGLGSVIARQLERQMGLQPTAADGQPQAASMKAIPPRFGMTAAALTAGDAAAAGRPSATALRAAAPAGSAAVAFAPAGAAGAPTGSASAASNLAATRQTEFVRTHTAAAKAVEQQTGIPANFMVAQAAHESGWGRREIKNADGSTSHNVFGIKAGANWNGPVATVTTTEYVDGVPRKVQAKFRAYASYEESFRDYAKLMTDSPRYAGVMATVASANASTTAGGDVSTASAAKFAAGLQRAGYATDPLYADKLTRMINTTLRLQRAMT